ncbi:uncharacterized protein LOC133205905 isoform X2 [Saccostrea echinata]|uniref:uncharacterized protein LOC133205905 isoform X2 n=1 Tax=Saccostrea echinata TaxID=191078 RepID=UPI002A7ECC67|nr:uncharacterized protein LOC133205905 isoform X2 [Saccostrea echinata]
MRCEEKATLFRGMLSARQREQPKTPKFQRLNGWDLPYGNESLDIVAWTSLQTALHSKKDRKKSKISTEDLAYRHVPNYRCSALENSTEFERHSLHARLFIKEKSVSEQTTVKPIKRSKTTLTLTNVRSTQPLQQKIGEVPEESFQETKAKDDIDVLTRIVEKEVGRKDENILKRSKSVPVHYMPERPENAPSFRRLLYYARKYGSNDDGVLDEEDEGYGSKTPSAEDKDVTSLFDGFSGRRFLENSLDSNGNGERKFAKFSYTHQIPKATSLFEESEDEKTRKNSERDIRCYKTGYIEERDKSTVRKLLNRSHTSIGHYESSTFCAIEDLKPAIVLRKITIQNAQEDNASSCEQPNVQTEKKTFYEPHKTIVRQNSFAQSQSDRAQYPVYCTSPEFKFSHLPQQRPSSKKQPRERNPSANGKKSKMESARKPRTPNLDLYRAHTSVCMPIGDLLPAVDRSLRKGNASKSKQNAQISQSMPDSLDTILSVRKSYDEVQQAGLDYIMNRQSKGMVTPTFRNSNSTTSLDSSTTIKSTSDRSGKVQYNTPSKISLDDFASVSSLSTSREETKPKQNTTGVTNTKTREGVPSLALSMSGIDIEIKHGILDKNANAIGKVRFTAHPDKDTKKKLRDAFSRFYNKQPYGASPSNKNWTEELKFMWNK